MQTGSSLFDPKVKERIGSFPYLVRQLMSCFLLFDKPVSFELAHQLPLCLPEPAVACRLDRTGPNDFQPTCRAPSTVMGILSTAASLYIDVVNALWDLGSQQLCNPQVSNILGGNCDLSDPFCLHSPPFWRRYWQSSPDF